MSLGEDESKRAENLEYTGVRVELAPACWQVLEEVGVELRVRYREKVIQAFQQQPLLPIFTCGLRPPCRCLSQRYHHTAPSTLKPAGEGAEARRHRILRVRGAA